MSIQQIDEMSVQLKRQQAFQINHGVVTAAERKQRIQQVIDMLVAGQKKLALAMQKDFGGRSIGFSLMNDVLGSLASLKYTRDHLEGWMAQDVRQPFAPYDQLGAKAEVMYQAKGVVGIIGTWNAPLFTLFSPLACVLGAGNGAILKPSEVASHTANAVAELVAEHMDPNILTVVTGDVEVGAAFSALPFDHLVFTGSTAVGKKIMRAAADNLVPVTLELGGKSPAVLSRRADLEECCRRLAIAKGTNGGQLCVSPDILYVPNESLDDVVSSISTQFAEFYPTIDENPDVVPVINAQHLQRVESYIADAKAHGAKVVMSHEIDTMALSSRRRPLSLVVNPSAACKIMQEEIFGPALVVLSYDKIEEVVVDIRSREKPLALYYYGEDQAELDYVLNNTSSGGVTVNDSLMHAAMHDAPFGGVGASGMGRYHGREGFLEFSHLRTIFHAPAYDPRGEWGMLPPFYEGFDAVIEGMVVAD